MDRFLRIIIRIIEYIEDRKSSQLLRNNTLRSDICDQKGVTPAEVLGGYTTSMAQSISDQQRLFSSYLNDLRPIFAQYQR